MSTELARAYDVQITSFAGGRGRGACVQIDVDDQRGANVDFGAVQLTRTQAEFVCDVLSKWLGKD